MQVWTQLEGYLPEKDCPLILALGNFDGLHLGHREIIKKVLSRARSQNGIPAVLTFFEHPQRVLSRSKEPGLLTSPQHRLYLFNDAGVQICFLPHFTPLISKLSPESFVSDWLVKKLKISEIHLGTNARFGCGRKGDGPLMKKLAQKYQFGFIEEKPVSVRGEVLSSTLIRQKIREGKLLEVQSYLGSQFSIFASVVRGSGRGKALGFPTANLQPHSEALPPNGVYPVKLRENIYHLHPGRNPNQFYYEAEAPSEWRQGVLNYGIRPTFQGESPQPIAEVHLFDYSRELYGKTVEVSFYPRLREERFFGRERELAEQIKKEILQVKDYFKDLDGR